MEKDGARMTTEAIVIAALLLVVLIIALFVTGPQLSCHLGGGEWVADHLGTISCQ